MPVSEAWGAGVPPFFFWILHTRLKPMWIKDINIKPHTLNLIKYTVEDSLKIFSIDNNSLKRWLIQKALRSTINKWDLITLKACVKERTLSYKKR